MSNKKKDKELIKIIGDGEAHLQNKIINDGKCYICKAPSDDDCVLLRTEGKKMVFVCTKHPGVVKEFISQYRMPPLGWTHERPTNE